MAEYADMDSLQMAYNALCSALWNLDRVQDHQPPEMLKIASIFHRIEALRAELMPIAWPTAGSALTPDPPPARLVVDPSLITHLIGAGTAVPPPLPPPQHTPWPGFCQACKAPLDPADLTWCPTCGASDDDE